MHSGDIEQLNARQAARCQLTPKVRIALIEVLNHIGPGLQKSWEIDGYPDDHPWPSVRTVWQWLGFSGTWQFTMIEADRNTSMTE